MPSARPWFPMDDPIGDAFKRALDSPEGDECLERVTGRKTEPENDD